MKPYVTILAAAVFVSCSGLPCFAACPSADLTGDCRVDFKDFAVLAGQWLDEGSYTLHVNSSGSLGVNISSSTGHGGTTNYSQTLTAGTGVTLTAPATVDAATFTGWTGDVSSVNGTISLAMDADKTVTANYELAISWVSINDAGVSGHEGFSGQMGKYEITNAQYCHFLNAALASGDITISADIVYGRYGSNPGEDFYNSPYYDCTGAGDSYNGATNGGAARIHYGESDFIVDSGFENHPVTFVTWQGATAFCNYYGYRLPTRWEWQAVADYDGSYNYGCGTGISNSIANYYGSTHPNGTTAVGVFGSYGYGMCDMAGNVWEWTSSEYSGAFMIMLGGSWYGSSDECNASNVSYGLSYSPIYYTGFRVCR